MHYQNISALPKSVTAVAATAISHWFNFYDAA
jgi:hypothetical protein